MGNTNPKVKLRQNINKVTQQEIRIQLKINTLQRQQDRLIKEMKEKSKDPEKVRVLLKRYVMQKRSVMKMYKTLDFVSNYKDRLESTETFNSITDTMLDVSDTLENIQSTSDITTIQQMMQQFNHHNMQNDVLQDTLMDTFATENDEEYESEIMQQILDEIGIDPSLLESIVSRPTLDSTNKIENEADYKNLNERFKALAMI